MSASVAALFVDAKGIYPELLGRVACYAGEDDAGDPLEDDARTYAGPDPVVAHPPCQLWVNFAAVNWKRYGRHKPAWYPGGDDGGCFASALSSVRKYGGVLEHPAGSHAWEAHHLVMPGADYPSNQWAGPYGTHATQEEVDAAPMHRAQFYWIAEVWQSAYGHGARKRTWLLYCGKRPPFALNWAREPGTHQCGWFDRNKPTLSKRAASATPPAFARELIRLAEWSRD